MLIKVLENIQNAHNHIDVSLKLNINFCSCYNKVNLQIY